ncbi:lipolytic protein [Pseudomonas luteola]|uniref:Lipolytic protein n=1 Tax=Pseudomonas luteola TaxID=47886 RepID=A0A2X2CCL9_PSELU|nr:alpha/beta hydrolase [Pseudomonas luteola]MCG7374138.1 alpha/beta hydrolase [Pseudomonas luteola]SPZ04873.1 lipolytic protein [Pseudomonas luteola]
MTYAPGIEEFVNRCDSIMPPNFYKFPIEEQRRLYQSLAIEFPYSVPENVSWSEQHHYFDGQELRFRMYVPKDLYTDGLIIYIRGGGFVVGSLDTHHSVVGELALKTGTKVLAVDFRLAPEHPFPAAIDDCYRALQYVHDRHMDIGIDPRKIIVAGDSSGGNMAVVLAMMSRDRSGPVIAGQALISPVLDFTRWKHGGIDAPLLTGGEMEFYTACYTPDGTSVSHKYVSPLVSGTFEDLPPAYIMGAEKDSLVVDATEYARLLDSNGTDVELVIEPGLVHAAVRARGISPNVEDAWNRYCLKVLDLIRRVQ